MSQTSQTSQTKIASLESKITSSHKKSKSSKSELNYKKMSAFYKEKETWQRYIIQFRRDLRNVKPIVDDKPPRLNISLLYDVETLKGSHRQVESFFNNNPVLVKRFHSINVNGGLTETFSRQRGEILKSNYNMRKAEAESIQRYNKNLKKIIEKTGPRLPTVEFYAKEWKIFEEIIENNSQFPLFWKVKPKKKEKVEVLPSKIYFKQFITEKSAKYPDKRPRVFFEISIRNVGSIGKMVAVLYSDYVPMTVKNFLAFCDPKAQLTYKGCLFYLIFENFYCQTGDVVENKGFGGTSIHGPYFGDEDHTLQHGERGILTMYNKIPNRNQCQFLITFKELKTLNGKNVAFGKIIRGFHVLDAIESVGSKMTGRPKVEIYISNCDEI